MSTRKSSNSSRASSSSKKAADRAAKIRILFTYLLAMSAIHNGNVHKAADDWMAVFRPDSNPVPEMQGRNHEVLKKEILAGQRSSIGYEQTQIKLKDRSKTQNQTSKSKQTKYYRQ